MSEMSKQPIYGFPCVEDPRDFDPDTECCSPAEIEAHRLACSRYGQPDYQPNRGCTTEYDESGQLVRHILRTSWGIGVNLVSHCDGCGEPDFDSLMCCHECDGPEFCAICWPIHEREHDEGGYD
jgi:hypothetical protein